MTGHRPVSSEKQGGENVRQDEGESMDDKRRREEQHRKAA
jgi:hypothetical protein